ncbi:MAG: hypothetical protein IMW86_07805 [Hydrogenibacillus sp.]|nr:hypothetical protein [Hydrogenibacillus sp.]
MKRVDIDLPDVLQNLPKRKGKRPQIDIRYPCPQTEDPSPEMIRQTLLARACRLPGVTCRPTEMRVPGGTALVMEEELAEGQPEAYIFRREFAIVRSDGSVHLPLLPEWGEHVLRQGWATIHPVARYLAGALPPQNLIVYAPRDDKELDVIWRIVQAGYFYARGWIVPLASS